MERNDLLRLQRTAAYYDSIGLYKKADEIDSLIREAALSKEERDAYILGGGILGALGGSFGVGLHLKNQPKDIQQTPPAIVAPAPKFENTKYQPVQENVQNEIPQAPTKNFEKPVVEEHTDLNFKEPVQERYETNIIPAPKPKPLSIPIKTPVKPITKAPVKTPEKLIAKSPEKTIKAPVKTQLKPSVVNEPKKPVVEKIEPKPQLTSKQKMELGDFGSTMDLMLNLEGKKSDDPRDRGGRTNFGVTQGTYNRWRDSKNLPRQDVFKITKEEAMQLYKKNFWGIIGGDKLPQKTAMALMSFALTDGPEDSVRLVQRMLKIPATGFMGPATLAKINKLVKKYGDEGFANKVLNRQIIRYQNDEQANIYGRGWVNRANKVKTTISKL